MQYRLRGSVIFTRYYITWLGCRQPFISTSYSDSSINHLLHYLIFCNHARLNLRIQQVMSPAWLNATHAFYYQFRVKYALWRPCSSRLKSARKRVQASTPFNIHCLLLSLYKLKPRFSRATSLTSNLPHELPHELSVLRAACLTSYPLHKSSSYGASNTPWKRPIGTHDCNDSKDTY
jgi:hypothetical protein